MTADPSAGGHEGLVAVVTGAASGIGLATAAALWQRGARVIAVDIDGPALERNCGDLSELSIVHDMAGDPAALITAIESSGMTPQILINNVGVSAGRPFLDLDDDTIERVWRTNLLGPLSLTRSIARMMIDSRTSGSIVFVSSVHSASVRRSLDYSTSKAAVTMAVRELADELGPHRIRVNAVSPGDIHADPVGHPITELNRQLREEVIPLDRLGTPGDIARTILFLTDEDCSAYITGADLVIDGGLSTTNWITTRASRRNEQRRRTTDPTARTGGASTSGPTDAATESGSVARKLGARLSSRFRREPG